MQAYNKVIRIKAWSRNILVLNLYNNYSENSTIALASRSSSSQLSNCISFYSQQASGTNIQARKTSTTEEKHYKNAIKKRAWTYKHKGARNIENRAIVEKTQLSKDLYYNGKENYKLNLF